MASHSFWKRLSKPGMDVAGIGLGFIALLEFMASRSSFSKGSSVTGHRPVSWMTFSIKRRSKSNPDFLLTTGSSGTAPLTAMR